MSVVVASFSGEAMLGRCLDSLAAWAARAEVVVATNAPADAVARLTVRFPNVRFFRFATETLGVRLRSLGLMQASGRLIALIEDHCVIGPEWSDSLCTAHRAGSAVVGGPIDNGVDRTTYDWALYLVEYSAYMPPMPAGPIAALLGANIAYDREALFNCHATWQDVFYETEVHDALRAAGHSFFLADGACVSSHLQMTLREAMAHLFTGGRRFGSHRRSRCTPLVRVFWILASPAVPLVMMARIVRRVVARRPRRIGTLLLGFPYLCCLVMAWSLGEASGYLIPVRRASVPACFSREEHKRDACATTREL